MGSPVGRLGQTPEERTARKSNSIFVTIFRLSQVDYRYIFSITFPIRSIPRFGTENALKMAEFSQPPGMIQSTNHPLFHARVSITPRSTSNSKTMNLLTSASNSLRPFVSTLAGRAGLATVLLAAASTSVHAQFNQTGAGPYDYNDPANWVGGLINGNWDSSLTLTAAQVVRFGADTVLTTGFNFNYTGNYTLRLIGVGGNRTITLGGDISVNPVSNRTVTIGSTATNQKLNVDLGGLTRTFTVNTSKGLSFVNVLSNGGLKKAGGGTLTLSGSNIYAGGTELTGGNITVNNNNGLGTGTVTFNGGRRLTVRPGANISNAIIIGTNTGPANRGLIEASNIVGTATISGPITINNSPASASGGHFAAFGANLPVLHVAGVITSPVEVTSRLGTVRFSGGGTGYTGLTGQAGTVQVGADDGIATSAAVTLGTIGAANLDLNGFDQTLVGVTQSTNAATIGNSSTASDSFLTITGTSTFAGSIVDTLGLGTQKLGIKVVSGSFTVSGGNSYTGTTDVLGGKFLVDGNQSSAAGAVTVAPGAMLGGTGTVGGATTIGGTHSAADLGTVGTQTFGSSLNYSSGSTFEWDVDTGTNTSDSVSVVGSLAVATSSIFKVVSNTAFSDAFWDSSKSWNVFGGKDFSGFTLNFRANNVELDAVDFSSEGYFSISGGTLKWTAVPEPTSALAELLLGGGLLRRRRQR
jgi:autotransporter-associated beta strand protein